MADRLCECCSTAYKHFYVTGLVLWPYVKGPERYNRGPRAVHLAWNTTSGDKFSLLAQRGIYWVKTHKHTNIIQMRQSILLRGYFWWEVPGVFMPLENCLLTLRERKGACFQRDCSKPLSTFLLPWPSIGGSSGNSFVLSRAGKTATAPIDQTAPESSCAQDRICSVIQDSKASPNYRGFP